MIGHVIIELLLIFDCISQLGKIQGIRIRWEPFSLFLWHKSRLHLEQENWVAGGGTMA